MSEPLSPTSWSTVAALPDYLLLVQTRQLARHEQALQILVLDHLREIEGRRLHLTRGYGSLFDYVLIDVIYLCSRGLLVPPKIPLLLSQPLGGIRSSLIRVGPAP